MTELKGCSCQKCVNCCWHIPGWFGSIEEVEGASRILNLTVMEFLKQYCTVEYWIGGDNGDILLPAPCKDYKRLDKYLKDNPLADEMEIANEILRGTGFRKASWGIPFIRDVPCVFLEKDGCKIHLSKPLECKVVFACKEYDSPKEKIIVPYWKKHQDWVRERMEEVCNKEAKDEAQDN